MTLMTEDGAASIRTAYIGFDVATGDSEAALCTSSVNWMEAESEVAVTRACRSSERLHRAPVEPLERLVGSCVVSV